MQGFELVLFYGRLAFEVFGFGLPKSQVAQYRFRPWAVSAMPTSSLPAQPVQRASKMTQSYVMRMYILNNQPQHTSLQYDIVLENVYKVDLELYTRRPANRTS